MRDKVRIKLLAIIFSSLALFLIAVVAIFYSVFFAARVETSVPLSQIISLALDERVVEIRRDGQDYMAVLDDDSELEFRVSEQDDLAKILLQAGISDPERLIKADGT